MANKIQYVVEVMSAQYFIFEEDKIQQARNTIKALVDIGLNDLRFYKRDKL